ncbi:MAG: carbamate kinase [Candidatus Stahlbacteria bacterium]|nr:carbamate kinase [Candidatus Stahlbacteria bacterium]
MRTAVIAIGGNAILHPEQKGTKEEHYANLQITCSHLALLIREGYDIVLTHGNGPQIGNIVLQNELTSNNVPPMPLDVCVAESQGEMGYFLQQVLTNKLREMGIDKQVVSMITQVVVNKDDKAFKNPTKPIGHYYTKDEALRLMEERKWQMVEDISRGGWRRVVPSPKPIDIVEKEAIMRLIFSSKSSPIVVIASGGGGIPVIQTENGYKGVEAVIDKDLAASILATSIEEELFIMLTDVPKVALNFNTPQQVELDKMTLLEAKEYLSQGHFPPGSMGPKIEAAILFLEHGGKEVIITTPDNLLKAMQGKAGTYIVKSQNPNPKQIPF